MNLYEIEGFSVRTKAAIMASGCKTADDARAFGEQQFLRLPNCGRKSTNEIAAAIGGFSRPPGPPDLSRVPSDLLLQELARRLKANGAAP